MKKKLRKCEILILDENKISLSPQARLISLYFDTKCYQEALQLGEFCTFCIRLRHRTYRGQKETCIKLRWKNLHLFFSLLPCQFYFSLEEYMFFFGHGIYFPHIMAKNSSTVLFKAPSCCRSSRRWMIRPCWWRYSCWRVRRITHSVTYLRPGLPSPRRGQPPTPSTAPPNYKQL